MTIRQIIEKLNACMSVERTEIEKKFNIPTNRMELPPDTPVSIRIQLSDRVFKTVPLEIGYNWARDVGLVVNVDLRNVTKDK